MIDSKEFVDRYYNDYIDLSKQSIIKYINYWNNLVGDNKKSIISLTENDISKMYFYPKAKLNRSKYIIVSNFLKNVQEYESKKYGVSLQIPRLTFQQLNGEEYIKRFYCIDEQHLLDRINQVLIYNEIKHPDYFLPTIVIHLLSWSLIPHNQFKQLCLSNYYETKNMFYVGGYKYFLSDLCNDYVKNLFNLKQQCCLNSEVKWNIPEGNNLFKTKKSNTIGLSYLDDKVNELNDLSQELGYTFSPNCIIENSLFCKFKELSEFYDNIEDAKTAFRIEMRNKYGRKIFKQFFMKYEQWLKFYEL